VLYEFLDTDDTCGSVFCFEYRLRAYSGIGSDLGLCLTKEKASGNEQT
jgi:hypothetical protein